MLGAVAYCLCRKDWRWLFAFVPLSTYAVLVGVEALWDASVGPAILAESRTFFIHWHLNLALVITAPVLGLWHGFRDRRRHA